VVVDVIMAAPGTKVLLARGPAFGPGDAVVEVAGSRGHATSGEHTRLIAGLDTSPQSSRWPAAGKLGMGQFPCLRISDGEPPLGLLMIFCDLSGDVGDDRSESGKLAGVVRECGEGVEIHANIDDPTPSFGLLTSKEVEQHIGPELVHRASLAAASKTPCESVDPARGR